MTNNCKDKEKFVTAEASTKAWLRTQNIIDKFLNILDYNRFIKETGRFSDVAKKRYGITSRLFYEENGKAIPNKQAFKQIDNAKGIFYQQGASVKPGVEELFNSNPELANAVYEALGFKTKKINLDFEINTDDGITINTFYKGENLGGIDIQKKGNEYFVRNVKSNIENQGIGTEIYKKAIEYVTQQGGVLKPDLLSAPQAYSIYKKLEREGLFKITNVSEQLEDGRYEIKGQSTGKLPISEITPQQKQQAQQAYSQYLDTIFPDSKVKDIVYHDTSSEKLIDEGFKKEFIGIGDGTVSGDGFYFYIENDDKKIYDDFIKSQKNWMLSQPKMYPSAQNYTEEDWDREFQKYKKSQKRYDDSRSFKIPAILKISRPLDKLGDKYFAIQQKLKKENPNDLVGFYKVVASVLGLDAEQLAKDTDKKYQELRWTGKTDIKSISDFLNEKYGYDSILGALSKVKEIVVFEPEQIHILGTKQDVEGFKEFVGKGQVMSQLPGVQASKASKETIGKVKKLIEQMGVNIVSLQEYLKGNPDVPSTGINALADTIKGIIAIAEGKEDVALTEEMVHVATSILEQVNPQLITNLISKISQYKIYNIVLEKYKNNKAYQLPDGKPNIRKIKKEAVDKLITEMIINMSEGSTEFPELMEKEKRNIIQQMWDAILSAFKSLYAKSEVDLFEETAQTILKGDLGARYYRIKPEVKELFQSNVEIANILYEALGFNYLKDFDGNINMLASDIASSYDGAKKVSDFIPEIQKHLQQAQQLYSAYLDTNPQVEIGSKEDIEGFKSFAETAPAEFKGGEGVFFQIEENEKVNSAFNKFKDMNDRMKLVDSNGVEKRHYTYDGEKLEKTVTTLKEKKDLKRTPEEKEIDDQKRLWGSEGHKFLENYITNNLINKDGYALTNPKEIEISTPLKDSVKKSIITFAKELIASYPEGTRFLIESKVANLKVKERIGSTIDFIAFEPITNNKGESDVKIDILDWKFTSFNTENNEDVPWYKQKEWKEQMGEYTKMAYNLGVERNQLRKARMIPFVTNYGYAIKNDKKSPLVAKSVEIGKVDSLKETNLYLLPVPVDFESTGNETIDQFISSLRKLYEKIYISSVTPEEKFAKNLRLDNISKAIRKLQLNLNFFPIYDVAKNFLVDAKETLKEFDNVNYSKISKEELIAKLQKLQEYQKSADKFVNLDDIFLSHISKEDMSPAEKKLLEDFGKVTVATKRMLEEIQAIQQEYVLNIAMKEGIVDEESADEILEAEKQVSAIDKNFLEGSKLAPKIIQLATKMILFTKNLININFAKTANEWEKILIPLEKEARAQGKSAFDMIGKLTERGPRLIKKLDSDFLDRIKKAKKEGNKQFLLDNLNLEEYKKLVDPVIQKGIDELDRTQFSSDEEEDVRIREKRKQNLKNSLDITSESFIGFEDYTFQHFYRKAMIEEGHYSKEYLEMSKSENALKVWNFFTTLNERAKSMGYLDKEGLSFFPLIEATTLQKMTQSGQIFKETKDFFKDMYTINPNEEQLYAKVDDETGELKKIIPKYFTRTNKDVAQLSTDLNKVGLMWIKSLMEYESAKDLEFSLLTMHSVEKHKGSLIIDSNGNIIFDGKNARVNRAENKNAELLQVIIDDYLYGINENLNSMGNALMSTSISKLAKTSEKAEKATVSTKKALKTGDILIRALALGLKPLIGVANWAGTQMQAYINAGGVYRFREFEKNNVKVTLPYGLSLLEKALLNEIIPLSGDSPLEVKQRQIASKKSIPNYLSTWTFTDVMMITNSFGERKLELANALTMIENSMLVNGKIVNIRQYLKAKDREARKGMSFEQRRELENSFQKRVDELKEGSTALINISKIVDNELIIEGVSNEELARFRMSVIDHARNLNGQMSNDDKMGYRRDTIFSSFMMFKGWIPKQLSVRGKAITKNITTGDWEYGRYRAFAKTIVEIGFRNITDLRDIVIGTDKGLAIINRILEEKKQQYYLQTGKELRITEEEFQDLMRSQVINMLKELFVIVSIIGIVAVSKLLAPDDDDDDIDKNRYKYFAKLVNKVSDEILFYVNPASADEMTRGSIIPALGLFSKVGSLLNATRKEVYYTATGDEKEAEKAYPIKYFINLIPVGAQFQNEVLPLIDAELAKEMGVRVSAESRRN